MHSLTCFDKMEMWNSEHARVQNAPCMYGVLHKMSGVSYLSHHKLRMTLNLATRNACIVHEARVNADSRPSWCRSGKTGSKISSKPFVPCAALQAQIWLTLSRRSLSARRWKAETQPCFHGYGLGFSCTVQLVALY